MPVPAQKKKLFVDDSVLIDLFTRLEAKEAGEDVRFRFVLALILMRKRLLIYETSRRHDDATPPRETWVVRLKGRDEQLEMLNPHLTEEQMQDVSRQMGEILNEGL